MQLPFILLIIAGTFIFILFFLYFVPVNLWITAVFSNVKISILNLILMRLRKVPPSIVVNAMINSTKSGLNITTNEIETHFNPRSIILLIEKINVGTRHLLTDT